MTLITKRTCRILSMIDTCWQVKKHMLYIFAMLKRCCNIAKVILQNNVSALFLQHYTAMCNVDSATLHCYDASFCAVWVNNNANELLTGCYIFAGGEIRKEVRGERENVGRGWRREEKWGGGGKKEGGWKVMFWNVAGLGKKDEDFWKV